MTYPLGSKIRIDIPDETDPDFRWHGEHGYILSGSDDPIYRVGLEDHPITLTTHRRDLRPPLTD